MPACAAPNCRSRSETPGVSLFHFPTDNKRRHLWLTRLQRDGWKPTMGARLCSLHFEPSEFKPNKLKPLPEFKMEPVPPKEITDLLAEITAGPSLAENAAAAENAGENAAAAAGEETDAASEENAEGTVVVADAALEENDEGTVVDADAASEEDAAAAGEATDAAADENAESAGLEETVAVEETVVVAVSEEGAEVLMETDAAAPEGSEDAGETAIGKDGDASEGTAPEAAEEASEGKDEEATAASEETTETAPEEAVAVPEVGAAVVGGSTSDCELPEKVPFKQFVNKQKQKQERRRLKKTAIPTIFFHYSMDDIKHAENAEVEALMAGKRMRKRPVKYEVEIGATKSKRAKKGSKPVKVTKEPKKRGRPSKRLAEPVDQLSAAALAERARMARRASMAIRPGSPPPLFRPVALVEDHNYFFTPNSRTMKQEPLPSVPTREDVAQLPAFPANGAVVCTFSLPSETVANTPRIKLKTKKKRKAQFSLAKNAKRERREEQPVQVFRPGSSRTRKPKRYDDYDDAASPAASDASDEEWTPEGRVEEEEEDDFDASQQQDDDDRPDTVLVKDMTKSVARLKARQAAAGDAADDMEEVLVQNMQVRLRGTDAQVRGHVMRTTTFEAPARQLLAPVNPFAGLKEIQKILHPVPKKHQVGAWNVALQLEVEQLKEEKRELERQMDELRAQREQDGLTVQKVTKVVREEKDLERVKIQRELTRTLSEKSKMMEQLGQTFRHDQVRAMLSKVRGSFDWTHETVRSACKVQMVCGKHGYDFLVELGLPFPSARTLRRRVEIIEVGMKPGDDPEEELEFEAMRQSEALSKDTLEDSGLRYLAGYCLKKTFVVISCADCKAFFESTDANDTDILAALEGNVPADYLFSWSEAAMKVFSELERLFDRMREKLLTSGLIDGMKEELLQCVKTSVPHHPTCHDVLGSTVQAYLRVRSRLLFTKAAEDSEIATIITKKQTRFDKIQEGKRLKEERKQKREERKLQKRVRKRRRSPKKKAPGEAGTPAGRKKTAAATAASAAARKAKKAQQVQQQQAQQLHQMQLQLQQEQLQQEQQYHQQPQYHQEQQVVTYQIHQVEPQEQQQEERPRQVPVEYEHRWV